VSHNPPFRAEHIGSLLRPAALREARQKFARGEIGHDQLAAAENAAIEDAIKLQERVGLKVATDGEFRRRSYHSYFYSKLGDIVPDYAPDRDAASSGHRKVQPTAAVNSKVKWTHPIHGEDFAYLRAHTSAVPKITIPGPCAVHFRGGTEAVTATSYDDLDDFWDDTVTAFQQELISLAEAGCSYVQIDETAFAKFGDPQVQETLAARGDNWSDLIDTYIDVTNRVLRGTPASLQVGMHLCRGNRGGGWHAEGSYDAVAERLFNALEIKLYLLEYDSPRAGDFAPLRYVPKDKAIVLGLVSTKTSQLEDKAELKRKVDGAARHVDIARLSVSPQCGFASSEAGNPITPETQEAKLRLVVELAHDIWGTA
jgi:5-methyltetrahydropteroyltriglutamate--homocysteine methyltransferase